MNELSTKVKTSGEDFGRIVGAFAVLGYTVTGIELERIITNFTSSVKCETGATLIRIVPAENDEGGIAALAEDIARGIKVSGVLQS
jgi:hypothetical protein